MAVLSTLQSTVEKPSHMEESDSESSHEDGDVDFEVKVDEYGIPLQLGAKYLDFFSSLSLKTREKYILVLLR